MFLLLKILIQKPISSTKVNVYCIKVERQKNDVIEIFIISRLGQPFQRYLSSKVGDQYVDGYYFQEIKVVATKYFRLKIKIEKTRSSLSIFFNLLKAQR